MPMICILRQKNHLIDKVPQGKVLEHLVKENAQWPPDLLDGTVDLPRHRTMPRAASLVFRTGCAPTDQHKRLRRIIETETRHYDYYPAKRTGEQ